LKGLLKTINKLKGKCQAEEGGLVHLHLPDKELLLTWESAMVLSRALHNQAIKAKNAEQARIRKAG